LGVLAFLVGFFAAFSGLAFAVGFLGTDLALADLVDLDFFFVAVGMFFPINSKKAVKYGCEIVQSQGAQPTFFVFFAV
jgi:hypothetical protein